MSRLRRDGGSNVLNHRNECNWDLTEFVFKFIFKSSAAGGRTKWATLEELFADWVQVYMSFSLPLLLLAVLMQLATSACGSVAVARRMQWRNSSDYGPRRQWFITKGRQTTAMHRRRLTNDQREQGEWPILMECTRKDTSSVESLLRQTTDFSSRTCVHSFTIWSREACAQICTYDDVMLVVRLSTAVYQSPADNWSSCACHSHRYRCWSIYIYGHSCISCEAEVDSLTLRSNASETQSRWTTQRVEWKSRS